MGESQFSGWNGQEKGSWDCCQIKAPSPLISLLHLNPHPQFSFSWLLQTLPTCPALGPLLQEAAGPGLLHFSSSASACTGKHLLLPPHRLLAALPASWPWLDTLPPCANSSTVESAPSPGVSWGVGLPPAPSPQQHCPGSKPVELLPRVGGKGSSIGDNIGSPPRQWHSGHWLRGTQAPRYTLRGTHRSMSPVGYLCSGTQDKSNGN